MKRFLKFFVAIVASAMTLFSCEDKEIEQILAQIAFDKASYEIGAEGGQLTVKVLTTVDWTAALSAATSLDNIEGITLAADKGKGSSEPIEIVVNFAVNEGFDRTVKLSLSGGGVSGSCTITQKGSEAREMEKVTVAQFLEKPEDASIYYELKGVIKSITNTDYSNFVMKDIDGDAEILIYGLAYESNVENQKVQLLQNEGIQEGDIITIASIRGSYNGTPEGMKSYYISHEKSATPMLKIDKETYEASASGEVFDLTVTSNIVTWTLSADVDWLSFEPATGNATTTVKVTVAEGEGGTGTITASADGLESVTCVVTRADLTVLTIAEFLTKPDDLNKAYKIGGIITDIVMDKDDATKPNRYGNFYIKDHTGEAYIYGLLPEKGGASGQDVITEKGLKIGDFVSLAAPKSSYNDAPQGKNAWFLAAYPAKTITEFLALEDDATKSVFYTVSGTVTSIVMDKEDATKPNKYGNIYIKDAEGVELYIYGVLDWEGKTANFESLGVKVGDVITGYAYKSSYKESPQAVNLQPVLIEGGEPVVEDKWDYTPGAGYLADANLWKAVDAAHTVEWFYNPGWAGEKEAPELAFKESTYKVIVPDACPNDWNAQAWIRPSEEFKLDASKTYNFSCIVNASTEGNFYMKLYKKGDDGNFCFHMDPRVKLEAGKDYEVKIEGFTPIASPLDLLIDFSGHEANTTFYIKDITLVEAGIPVLNFGWTDATVVNQTVAFNAEGAAHWYIQRDASVDYNVEVVGADGAVITEGVTIEKDANHIAINYAKNTTPYEKVWKIVATTTANVENPRLEATLTQGAYEYSDIAELNDAVMKAGKDASLSLIVNIPEDQPLEVTRIYETTDKSGNKHKSVFLQNNTGALLLYDVTKPDGISTLYAVNKQIVGKFTVTTALYNGLPEVKGVSCNLEDIKISYPSNPKYYCFTRTIAEIEANYPKFVNAKCLIKNVEVTQSFGKTKSGEIKDDSGKLAVYNYSSDLTVDVPVGSQASKIVVWPTIYNNHQLGFYEASQLTITSIAGAINMPSTLNVVAGGEGVSLEAVAPFGGTITYESSDPNYATVSAEGVVTGVAAGRATITASVPATTVSFNGKDIPVTEATATCAVTVTETALTTTWELASLATITASDLFVVACLNDGTYYAMSNDKGTGAAPAAVALTVEGSAITSEVTNNIVWSMTSSDAGFSVHPNGDTTKWLYCTNSNNGVRVGTNDNKTFKVDSSTGYFVHNGTSRYVGVYNKADWRCYTSINDNIKNQRFVVFKKVVK